jgi:hypothetical protein
VDDLGMIGLNYLGMVLLGLGGLLSLWTLRGIVRRRALLRDPVRVKGEIVRVRHVAASDTDTVSTSSPGKFYATVRYQTEARQTLERELPPSGDPDKFQVGAVLRLVYQRGDPANVVDADLRWADLVLIAIGSLIVLGIGALLCFCVEGNPAQPADDAMPSEGRAEKE